jgi:1-phosphatidylinositol-3-phosphate 5-kinase
MAEARGVEPLFPPCRPRPPTQEREHLRVAVARLASARPDLLLVERSVARAAQEELLARGISLVQHIKPELLERIARATGAKVRRLGGGRRRPWGSKRRARGLPPTAAAAGPQLLLRSTARANFLNRRHRTPTPHPQIVPSVEELDEGVTGACRQFRIEPLAAPAPAAAAAPPPASSTAARPAPAAAAAGTLMVFDGCPRPLGCTVLLRGDSAAELTKVKRVAKLAVLAAYHSVLEGAFLAEELGLALAALAPAGGCAGEGHAWCVLNGAGRWLQAVLSEMAVQQRGMDEQR